MGQVVKSGRGSSDQTYCHTCVHCEISKKLFKTARQALDRSDNWDCYNSPLAKMERNTLVLATRRNASRSRLVSAKQSKLPVSWTGSHFFVSPPAQKSPNVIALLPLSLLEKCYEYFITSSDDKGSLIAGWLTRSRGPMIIHYYIPVINTSLMNTMIEQSSSLFHYHSIFLLASVSGPEHDVFQLSWRNCVTAKTEYRPILFLS